MTVPEALAMVKQVGAVEIHGGNLRLRFPEKERARLQPALHTLRKCKTEVLAMLGEAPPAAKIETEPSPEELAHASVGRAGVRLMALEGGVTIGIWSDLDGPEVRAALRTFGPEHLPVRYLDGDVPMKYKLRRVEGEPVPMNVLAEMERPPAEPWNVRDRMLNEMGWSPKGIPWAEWKAQALNRLLLEQGVAGKPGRITATTVRLGEQRMAGKSEPRFEALQTEEPENE